MAESGNSPQNQSSGDRGKRRAPQGNDGLSNYVFGKVQPQAVPLEEAVLGALMLDREALPLVMDILRSESFYTEAHQIIYRAIIRLFERSNPVDLLTLTEELKKSGELEKAGGGYYLVELTHRVASAANIEYHARIIAQKHIQRELISVSTNTIRDAYEDTTDVFTLLDEAEKGLFSITQNNLSRSYESMGTLSSKVLKQIEELSGKADGLTGVPSGFTDLDRLTSGWQPSDLVIIAARPGMGKTSLVLAVCLNAARDFNKGVALFSLEMASTQLVQRLISMESEIAGSKMRNGKLEDYEWQQLQTTVERLNSVPIFIDDTPAINIFELRAKCRRLKQQHDIQLIIIDYLQLMTGATEGKGGNREQEIASISRALKSLAKEINVPVIALSQLSRAVETRGGSKRPQLSDLRESGCLTGDTLLTDAATGKRYTIQALAEQQQRAWFSTASLQDSMEVAAMPISNVFYSGRKPVFILTTKSGRQIRATANHPFFKLHGWTRLDALRQGDKIALPRKIKVSNPSNPYTQEALIHLAQNPDTQSGLPDQLFECDEQHIALFLKHLWAKDDHIDKGNNPAPAPTYTTSHPVVAEQVQHLLLRLGIESTRSTVCPAGSQPAFQVRINGFEYPWNFLQTVGTHEEHAATQQALCVAVSGSTVPTTTWNQPSLMEAFGLLPGQKTVRTEFPYNGPANLPMNLCHVLPYDPMERLTAAEIFWDEILSIIPDGEEDVYDATVPVTSNFVANDIIVHNSIEQDADMVAFIYRPEYYQILEDESGQSLKGIAEFIIAKHRHGALETVRLKFTDTFAKFSNLDDPAFVGLDAPLTGPFQPSVVTRPSRMNDEDIPF